MFKKKIIEVKVKKEVEKIEKSNVYVLSQEVVNNGNGGYVIFHLSDGTDSLINPNK